MKKIKMKNMLVASALVTVLGAGSTYAADDFSDMYVKLGVGMGMGAKSSYFDNVYGETTLNPTLGIGFNAVEKVRTEVTATYVNGGPKYEESGTTKPALENEGFTVFAAGHVDVMEFGMTTISAMGGLGVSMVESKASATAASNLQEIAGTPGTAVAATDLTFKNEFAFSWKLGGNLSFEFNTDAQLEIGYEYVNLGKPGKATESASAIHSWAGDARTSHMFTAAVRYCL